MVQKPQINLDEKKSEPLFCFGHRLSYCDPEVHAWVAEPGRFETVVGASSRDIRLTGEFELK